MIQRYEAIYKLPCSACGTWTASRTVVAPSNVQPACCATCDAWVLLSDVEKGMCIGAALLGMAEAIRDRAEAERWDRLRRRAAEIAAKVEALDNSWSTTGEGG